MRYVAILLCLFSVAACGTDAAPPANSASAAALDAAPEAAQVPPPDANEPLQTEPWHYPRERIVEGNRVIIYTPQIRSWPDFAHFEAVVAVEFHPKDGSPAHYGTTTLSGATEVDLDKRLVIVTEPKVEDVTFPDKGTEAYDVAMTNVALRERVEIPLDMFLLYLSDDVLETPPPKGFNTKAPPIYVAETPTLLLFINGKAVLTPIEKTGLELVVNANFPLLRDTASGVYYLITGPNRLQANELAGPWKKAGELPGGFAKIDPKGEQAAIAAAVATPVGDAPTPTVIQSSVPSELIVTDGKPELQEIPETGGLQFVSNTDSPLFLLKGTYYYLVSGRWFETKRLEKGPWKFVPNLPDAFSKIPADNEMAEVRASVPGTVEAKAAALEALLPTRNSVAVGAAPDLKVSYGGEPKFEAIPGTDVARAVNSGNDVIQYDGNYYLCFNGAWYISTSPNGPWTATATVPDAIYKIPPESPAYPVTQVTVYESTPTTVVYSYPPSYSTGIFVAYGVPWYGTGWYYPPYIYGPYYYPYWGSYGHGYWYSGATGAYGSRSVWYGPYGGYSYSQGYNPNTGRYGYVETGWDGEDWKSHSEKYNPRTGVATETSRHYSANDNMARMSRTVEGPNGGAVAMERKTDFDNRTMTTNRETSNGGSSSVTRQGDGNGNITKSGTVTTGSGKTATIDGQHQIGQGGTTTINGSGGGQATIDRDVGAGGTVTRDGTFSKNGQTVDTETTRRGDTSVTKAQGSGGGQAASISQGGNRASVVQSGSGDIYAGSQGNVYKKTDGGWQHYDNGNWQDVPKTDRPASSTGESRRSAQAPELTTESIKPKAQAAQRDRSGASGTGSGYGGGNYGDRGGYDGGGFNGRDNVRQLDRDARARSGGYDRFEQRRSMSGGGGFNRGGMRGGGRGGGGGRRR